MCEYYGKDKQMHSGEYPIYYPYMPSESSTLDTNFPRTRSEHKHSNVIKLDNGQFIHPPTIELFGETLSP